MKKAFWLVPIIIVATGCAATDTRRMSMDDLNRFRPDCSRKNEQLAWLRAQMPSQWEQQRDSMAVTSIGGTVWSLMDGTYDQRRDVHDRRTQAVIRSYISELERYCPNKPRPAGCVTVRDSTQNGSSQGQKCYDGKRAKPVIDRWQPMVDQ